MKTILEFNNVTKIFSNSRHNSPFLKENGDENLMKAVDSVSFSIAKGNIVGLVGRTGCGKSTLARIAVRLLMPEEGVVIYNRKFNINTLTKQDIRHFRRHVRMLFQDPSASLNPSMTVYRIIEEPIKLYLSLTKNERREKVKELLHEVNMDSSENKYPFELSCGEKRRVSLARGLSFDPHLIIADEVTSSLDSSTKHQIMSILSRRNHQDNMSLLLISHDLRLVRQWCHRINVMEKGQIVETLDSNNISVDNVKHDFTRELFESLLEIDE